MRWVADQGEAGLAALRAAAAEAAARRSEARAAREEAEAARAEGVGAAPLTCAIHECVRAVCECLGSRRLESGWRRRRRRRP